MLVQNHTNLNEMMRKAPLNPDTVAEFRDQALQAVDQAIDIFFKPDREVAEGKQAYDQLSDVERALRSYQGRFQSESQKTSAAFSAEAAKLTVQSFKGDVGATASLLPNGKPLKDGHREVDSSCVRAEQLSDISTEQGQIAAVVQRMSEVLPLYGSVAMVPGPLSVSLKDHLKESLQWSFKSNSSSQSRLEEESYRLLTLSAGKKVVTSGSSSSSQNEGKQETMTIDERVMPGLHEIRSAITRLGYAPEESTTFSASQRVTEWEKTPATEGILWWQKDVVRYEKVNEGGLEQQGSALARPARVHMHGSLGNEGLTQPGAGADLVDLVAKAELSQDFVDTLRERSLKVLDGAVETLFNTRREVAEGRQRYDELVNLQRAVELATQRFGRPGDYYNPSHLADPINKLNEVTPLYACVAMVPGEMSSSVKNHAKELFEARSQASSGSWSNSHEEKISLFGSISESTGTSSSSSSSSGYVRQETTTTDERIMPTLHDLRMQLDQLDIAQDRLQKPYLMVRQTQPEKRR